ncbi:MAG: type I-C CRISPR-associated endonuclease Cas1c [Deltaproteobacteria bacterium]|nr:type I-C CRISPR-associated endonuclease Cas1c [Deltaproteobacteria bacterium]
MANFLNILYVTTQGAYVHKDHENVVVEVDRQPLLRVPVRMLGGVVCFGRVTVSPFLIGFCAERGIAVSFMTESGAFLGRVEGPVSGNVLLRREQFRKADRDDASAAIAKAIVLGKVRNLRAVLQRGSRERSHDAAARLNDAADALRRLLPSLEEAGTVEEIRGYEGQAAAVYFGVFDDLIATDDPAFRFEKRSRRPPLNRLNAMLSFGYALLLRDCAAALQAVGLDPAVGFLHADRPGRLSLALDLMEEFRAVLVDRMVFAMVNRRQIAKEDFEVTDAGTVSFRDGARKAYLVEYQNRKAEKIVHPIVNETAAWALVPHIQARLLARTIRGDLDEYPAFPVR